MNSETTVYVVLLCLVYAAGTQHLLSRLWNFVRSKLMPSHPNGPRPVSRTVRNDLKVVEADLDMADRKLNRLAQSDPSVVPIQALVRGAIITVMRILRLGVDDSDNGNGNGNGE